MDAYPIKLSYHVRDYYFGERLIPEMLGKQDAPEGVVAETWEISDYRETTGTVANGPYAGRTLHELVEEFPDELVGEGWRGPHFPLLDQVPRRLPHAPRPPARRRRDREKKARRAPRQDGGVAHPLGRRRRDDTRRHQGRPARARTSSRRSRRKTTTPSCRAIGMRPGDTVYVPGGILHTFGPDTLILEVQQTSDLGQFVMPFDLYGNRLDEEEWDANIEATLDELKTDILPRPNPGLVARRRRQQARAVLRRAALRPGTLDAHRSRTRSLRTRGASSRSRTWAKGRWSSSTRAARRRSGAPRAA